MTTVYRSGATFLAVAALSVGAAVVVATSSDGTAGLMVVAAVVAFAAWMWDAPVPRALVLAVLAVSATVDLARRLEVGPVTAYAWLTGALAVCACYFALIFWSKSVPAGGRLVLRTMVLFPLWTVLSLTWARPDTLGVQNILLYVAFPAVAAVCAIATATGALSFQRLRSALAGTFVVGSALYAVSLALDGPGGHAVVDARAYAAFAAVGVAWCGALARYGYRLELRLALVMLALSFLSLSRGASAVALLVMVLSMFGLSSMRAAARTLTTVGLLALLVVGALVVANPFAARFSEPDVIALPGGIHLSVSGRGKLWSATWQSALESPIVGRGAGSSQVPVERVDPIAGHPHNDYLRVFHDFGLVGLVLLVGGLVSAATRSIRFLRRSRRGPGNARAVHLAAILALLALALEMVTDNSLVYPFVVVPVAVIVGASLAAPDPRSRPRAPTRET